MASEDNRYCPHCGQDHGQVFNNPIICAQCTAVEAQAEIDDQHYLPIIVKMKAELATANSRLEKYRRLSSRMVPFFIGLELYYEKTAPHGGAIKQTRQFYEELREIENND